MIRHKTRWLLVGLMWPALAALAVFLLTLSPGQLAVGASGEILGVQSDTAVVRTAPSEGAEVLLSLSKGDKVLEFRRQGNWVKVAIFGLIGKEGWVRDALLGKTPPGKAPPSLSEDLPASPETPSKPLSPSETEMATFVLYVRFPIARKFRIACKIIIGEEEKIIEIKGRLPKALSFSAEALSCVVNSGGSARVSSAPRTNWGITLRKGTKLLASFDGYAKGVLLKSPGPWGKAKGAELIKAPKWAR